MLRGKWILNNILGTPPPDPPPNVPALVDRKTQAKTATLRERMQVHRDNPACAACHAMIDPAGFALENFDAVGRWRVVDESFNPIDASGVLPDGTAFDGVAELRAALVRRPEQFVSTMTEKLLTYALGRGLTHADMPAVRRILREVGGWRLPGAVHHSERGAERSVPVEESAVMIITRKSLPRRTFLRGLGAAVALPLLDAMAPALTATARTAAAPVRRLGFFYGPNGMFLSNFPSGGEGRPRLRDDPDPAAARAVPRPVDGGQRAQQPRRRQPQRGGRGPQPRPRRLAQRRPPLQDRGGRPEGGQDHRPVRGGRARRRDVATVAGADHRFELPGRQLRERLRLRLPSTRRRGRTSRRRSHTSATPASSSSGCSATVAA